jgi:hypothetical protein
MVHFRQHPGYVHVVDVPEDFKVGIPRRFPLLVGLDGKSQNTQEPPDGVWVEVEGGGLPIPLVVRIDSTPDGRFIVTGMLLGRDDHREIDWATLRGIKPASIIRNIFAGFDPRLPDKKVDDAWQAERVAANVPATFLELVEARAKGGTENLEPKSHPPGSVEETAAQQARDEFVRALKAHEIWRLTGGEQRSPASVTEVNRPRAAMATNLTEFARTYLNNVAADPRRATTATAHELHISRATAIRRIKECRDLGLIPPQERT